VASDHAFEHFVPPGIGFNAVELGNSMLEAIAA
jgi:hypothetical protein